MPTDSTPDEATFTIALSVTHFLDGTLICYAPNVPCEPNRVPFLLRSWFDEPLRLGTVELMKELRHQGHRLWIYTTSYRYPKQLQRCFRFYGIEIEGVINQELHERFVGSYRIDKYVSKYPPAFYIDLHVDDLEGVGLEGAEHGFKVVVVSVADEKWTQRMLEAVQQLPAS